MKVYKLIEWLKDHPDTYRVRDLAIQHGISRSVALSALRELENKGKAKRRLGGRNTRWIVKR